MAGRRCSGAFSRSKRGSPSRRSECTDHHVFSTFSPDFQRSGDMTVLNMDGIADPRLFSIGAGILEINLKDPNTSVFNGYRDMGEVSVVTPSSSDERFKKKS